MIVVEFIYTDEKGKAVGILSFKTLYMSLGNSGNEIEIVQDSVLSTLKEGSLVYAPGTEYGGLIRDIETDPSSGNTRDAKYTGPTWSGVLIERIVEPPQGQEHYRMQGEANEAISELISSIDLDWLFVAGSDDSGIQVSTDLDRFCDAYAGIRKALSESGARLEMSFDHSLKKVVLSAKLADSDSAVYSSINSPIKISKSSSVNHLICAGKGEGTDRVVVHLYADKEGNVSRNQTLFGSDRIDAFYENTTSDEEDIVADGTKKLQEAQNSTSVQIEIDDSYNDRYEVDQLITGYDVDLGIVATASIGKKTLNIDSDGIASFKYEPAEDVTTKSLSSGSSGTTVATYTGGKGISISGRVISAEVDSADLAEIENEISGTVQTVAGTYPVESVQEGRQVTLSIDLVTATDANSWFSD